MDEFFNNSELSALARVPTSSWVPEGMECWNGCTVCTVPLCIPAQLAGFASLVLFQTSSEAPVFPKIPAETRQAKVLHPCLLDQLQVQGQLLSAVSTGR